MTTMERTDTLVAIPDFELSSFEEIPVNGPHCLLCHRSSDLSRQDIGKRLVENVISFQEVQSPHEADKPFVLFVQGGEYSLLAGLAKAFNEAKQARRLGGNVVAIEVWPELLSDGSFNAAYGYQSSELICSPGLVFDGVTVTEASTGRAADRMYRKFQQKFQPAALVGVAAFEQYGGRNKTPTTYITALANTAPSDEAYAYFTDAPRREQSILLSSLASTATYPLTTTPVQSSSVYRSSQVWSSPTARFRTLVH